MRMTKIDQNKVRYMDLLWRYFEKNRNFSNAARVLAKLADLHRYGLYVTYCLYIEVTRGKSKTTKIKIFCVSILRSFLKKKIECANFKTRQLLEVNDNVYFCIIHYFAMYFL